MGPVATRGGRTVARPSGGAATTLPRVQEFIHDIHKRRSVEVGALEEEAALDPTELLGIEARQA